jgi:two-component system, chemotaxis family, CheB/CheR fusion protein
LGGTAWKLEITRDQNTPNDGTETAPARGVDATNDSKEPMRDEPQMIRFPIVGLGASAGGLEALRVLFDHLPVDPGIGFVVIQHLDPDRPSMLTKVLEGGTHLPVVEATNGMRVEKNRVHVIPSGFDLSIHDGVLELVRRERTGKLHLPIDAFFRSLAEDSHGQAIGVVLSGSGSDGTEGLRAIKCAGGISIAQEPESAQFRDMPANAIAAGVVDFHGTPERIASELAWHGHHPYVAPQARVENDARETGSGEDRELGETLEVLRRHTGLDFSGYKRTTVQRRIEKRMALRHMTSMGEYARAMQESPGEAKELAQDMFIHVTSFFRDPEAFEALKQQVLDELAKSKGNQDSIRIWVPGCSTGEEAYALTMCLLEVLEGRGKSPTVKVFGSDISDKAIEIARQGRYSESAVAEVDPERLARFFERFEGGYRISKRVRDLLVFVKHDITRDAPFAKLDLISCRNLLIYFDVDLQRRVFPMLHYCLSRPGYLFLGKSESIAGFHELFAPVDKEHRIFVKTGESSQRNFPLPAGREAEVRMSATLPSERRQPAREAQIQADNLMLTRYAPPGVIVNDRLEVIQFRGRTGAYLEPAPGQPQANLLRMAREGLAAHLHEVIERAKTQSTSVRKEGLRIEDGGEARPLNLVVIPLASLADTAERYYLILFEEVRAPAASGRAPVRPQEAEPVSEASAEIERLKAELVATKDYLQVLMAEHQSSSNELAAANEELVAANEELQSTNEELQSAKEELQSTNEELSTLNDQLRSRNLELDQVASDLVNVLASVEIPVVIVDLQLRVRRFTPTMNQVASFIHEDVGRPIEDLKLKLQVDDLGAKIKSVIDGVSAKEWEITDQEGRWFRMQIRPYRTSDNRLEGAVLSFVDVHVLKRALEDAERARDFARGIVETVTSALLVLEENMHVVSANEAFHQLFGLPDQAAVGRSLFELASALFETSEMRRDLEDALGKQSCFSGMEVTAELPPHGRKILSLTCRPILFGTGSPMVLLAIDDVTGLRTLEAERTHLLESERQARVEAERANRAKDLFLATLSHELRTPLSTMLLSAQILTRAGMDDRAIERASASIERSAKAQARLIDDLLDVSRIVSGKLLLDLGPVDLAATVQEAVDIACPSAQAKGLDLSVTIEGEIGHIYGDAARLLQVVNNLLTNAIKFTPRAGRIAVRLDRVDGQARLTVADNGIGISAEVMPYLFSKFVQADSSVTRTHGGLGLGLSIVRHLVNVHRGEVRVESPGEGQGATFIVTLPLGADHVRGEKESSAHTGSGDIKGIRVLLVEDDDDTRESLAAVLGTFGADVRAVPSAAAGLAALEEFHAQAIISDIAMPGEDGFSFIQKIRKRDADKGGRVPAAALTALASEEDRQRAMQSGVQLHIAKPIDSAHLATVVSMLASWKL